MFLRKMNHFCKKIKNGSQILKVGDITQIDKRNDD